MLDYAIYFGAGLTYMFGVCAIIAYVIDRFGLYGILVDLFTKFTDEFGELFLLLMTIYPVVLTIVWLVTKYSHFSISIQIN